MVPSVNVVVTNDQGQILLIRRSDNDNWAVPGGAIDLGESMAQAAVRETKEESGIDCEITGLVGIYTDPKHVILYTSNGEARQEFSIVLTARPVGGQPTPSDESSEVRWVDRAEVADYTMDRSMRLRVRDYLESSRPAPPSVNEAEGPVRGCVSQSQWLAPSPGAGRRTRDGPADKVARAVASLDFGEPLLDRTWAARQGR